MPDKETDKYIGKYPEIDKMVEWGLLAVISHEYMKMKERK